MMDKREAEQRAQELLDFYGSGKYKGYEEVTMPDGSPGVRISGFVPGIKDMTMSTQERDTHFQGIAAWLAEKIEPYVAEWSFLNTEANGGKIDVPPLHTLIAQFLHDFAKYVLTTAELSDDLYGYFSLDDEARVHSVPDLAAWPEQSN